MRRGKYLAKTRSSPAARILILIAAISLCSGAVFAYLRIATGPLTNSFNAATAGDPTVSSDASGIYVDVGNPGYAVYVRAKVVVTWQDPDGHVLGQAPVEGTDYTIDLNTTGWFQKDGFYYHEAPVTYDKTENTAKTAVLISSYSVKDGQTPTGYSLHIAVVSQTVQALGTTDGDPAVPAVTAAWGVSVDGDGNLIP